MSRDTVWRNAASVAVSSHQDQALGTTMLFLRSYGPTAFLLRPEGETRNFKVCLATLTPAPVLFSPRSRSCSNTCADSFQLGLVERQFLELLQGSHRAKAHRTDPEASAASGTWSQAVPGPEAGSVCRKAIQAQDVCPICQEELLQKKQPVSYCRFGCGINVHISCMKVWADHQRLSGQLEVVKCPLCREDFSSLKLLHEQVKNTVKLFTAAEREKPDGRLGVLCCSCRVSPISGTCFNSTWTVWTRSSNTNSCPLDGFIIYSPLTWRTPDRKISAKLSSCLPSEQLDDFLQACLLQEWRYRSGALKPLLLMRY